MKQKEFSKKEIVELLAPLIDFSKMKTCSLSSLKNDSGNIINLLKTTGKPLKLTHKGIMIAFVCDPNVYRHIEERRRNLEKLLLGEPASFVSTIGRRPMLSASEKVFRDIKCCILKIESLKSSINSKACELYSLKEELEKTEELFESIPTPEGHACQKTKKS